MRLTRHSEGFHLTGMTGAFQDRVFNLSREFTIGRSPASSLFVPDVLVSRNHARIYKKDNVFYLEDLKSQNGTFLNRKRIHTVVRLKNGDIIKIGNTEFLFSEPETEDMSEKELAFDSLKENFILTKDISSVQIEEIKSFEFEKQTLLALLRIGEVLQSTHDIERILQNVLNEIIEYTNADAGFIFTSNEKWDSFVLAASAISSKRDDPLARTIKPSKTLLNWVVKNRTAVISRNITDDTRFSSSESIIALNICSILSMPAIKEERVLGALQLMSLDPLKSFTKHDLEFVTLVARLLAVSIDNSMLHLEKDATISTLKEVQAVLVNTQNELIEKEKFALLGKLSAGIVHEVKNLLGPIVMSDLLKESYPEDAFVAQYVQTLNESYNQILSLMNELKHFAAESEDKMNMEHVELADVVQEIVRFMRLDRNLMAKSRIETEITPVTVFTDRSKLKTVLLNLVRNALEATLDKPEGRVVVRNRLEGSDVFISVIDNGKGISEENLKTIWEPFFSTGGGMGMGLTVVKRLVTAMHGEIRCKSVPGAGSIFEFSLKKPS